MTRKQLIILVLLLVTALVPILTSGKKPKGSSKSNPDSVSSLSEASKDDSRSALTTDPDLLAKADQVLSKLSALSDLGPIAGSVSADEVLRDSQFLMPTQEMPVSTPAPTVAPEVVAKVEESFPPIFSEESSSAAPEVKRSSSKQESGVDVEKLQLKIVSLEARLDEQKRTFDSRAADLKSKLDIQESENVKLSHQIQNAENNSVDAQKLSNKLKDLELKLEKAKTDLVEEKKRVDDSKALRTEYSKRLNEEQKVRKSIEEQLESAVKNRDEQAKDNEKLRRVVGDFEKRVKLIEEQRLALSEDKEQVLLKQLGTLRKELTSAQGALEELRKRQKIQGSEFASAGAKIESLQSQLVDKQRESDELSVKLATAERLNERSKDLQQELLAARNELMLAQEQVRTLISTSKNPNPDYQARTYPHTETIQPTRTERPVATPAATSVAQTPDYLTVEVTARKAALRAGAGEENSTVMEIQQGSKLMVETREGDWYRVITPKGQRAYLRADLAVELDGNGRPRSGAPGIKSVNPRPVRTLNPTPPDSDPLVELLGRQLKDRKKAPPTDDSLSADGDLPPAPGPTGGNPPEDEMEAFETLKKGMNKEAP